jgi:tRNA A-37 threonylcarbamoyl transferase component Bud32
MIFVKYSGHKEENRHYVDIAAFLKDAGVPVPEIFHHDPAEGLIWMQDLGELDLPDRQVAVHLVEHRRGDLGGTVHHVVGNFGHGSARVGGPDGPGNGQV